MEKLNSLEPKVTDMHLALFWVGHIEEPCEVPDGTHNNVRGGYLIEAKKALTKMTNPDAKKLLEEAIQKYE